MTNQILIATHNQAKFLELKSTLDMLSQDKLKTVSLKALGIASEAKETGKTLCQNAKIKAKYYAQLTDLPTIADDGGLFIPSLNNQPGIKSKRWLGYEATDKELINYTLKQLKGLPKEKRLAYLKVCLSFYNPKNKNCFFSQEAITGYIAQKPWQKIVKGYPFRALFIVNQYKKYYDQLTVEEHNQLNHRIKALKKIFPRVIKSLI